MLRLLRVPASCCIPSVCQHAKATSEHIISLNSRADLSSIAHPSKNFIPYPCIGANMRIEKYNFQHPLLESPHNYKLEKSQITRCFSDQINDSMPSQAETKLINILKSKFPTATDIAVVDISGGCGSMYEVFVESPEFKGLRLVKQHKLVTEALKGDIQDMHGIRISTAHSQ